MRSIHRSSTPFDRGVATSTGYILTLAVASILVTTVLMAGGGMVEGEYQYLKTAHAEEVGLGVRADIEQLAVRGDINDISGTLTTTYQQTSQAPTATIYVTSSPTVCGSGGGEGCVIVSYEHDRTEPAYMTEITVPDSVTLKTSQSRTDHVTVTYNNDADTLAIT